VGSAHPIFLRDGYNQNMTKLDKLIKKLLSKPPEIRSKGSHHAFENEQGEVIIIPKKGGKKVKRTYIEAIIKLLNLEDQQND
jgi:predicted RNA binding protein YcfA (HicA-like mRNA interferase family)